MAKQSSKEVKKFEFSKVGSILDNIAKNIPIQFLGIFYDYSKMVQPLRIRYRGSSKHLTNGYYYRRPRDYVHRNYADSFAIHFNLVSKAFIYSYVISEVIEAKH